MMMIALYTALVGFDVDVVDAAEQYKVAIPPFRLTLFPADSDFNKKAAKKVFQVASEYLSDRLDYGGVSSGGYVIIDKVSLDFRSWSFREKRNERRKRYLRRDYMHKSETNTHRRAAECTICSDKQTVNMITRGITCRQAKDAVASRCREDPYWVTNRACEYSCWLEGRGYSDIKQCCDPNARKEVILKSEKPHGGYVIFTADSVNSLPDQSELFSRLSSSLFPSDASADNVSTDAEGGLAGVLGYSNYVWGEVYAVDPPKEGIIGLITESSLSPTAVQTIPPTNAPTASPTSAPAEKSAAQPTMQPTPKTTRASATALPTSSPLMQSTFSPTASPVKSKPVKAPITMKPTTFPSRSPTRFPTMNPTASAILIKNDISEALNDSRNAEGDEGKDEERSTSLTKSPDQESHATNTSTAIMAGAAVASLAIVLLGAIYIRRRRRYRKEFDTASDGNCDSGPMSPSRTTTTGSNINGDKSCQLRDFDALHAIDEDPLKDVCDDEGNTCLDLSHDTDYFIADSVDCGEIKTIPDDNATAPLSPLSQTSSLSPLKPLDFAQALQVVDSGDSPGAMTPPDDGVGVNDASNTTDNLSPTAEGELTMVEPKIVASPATRLALTSSDAKSTPSTPSKSTAAPFSPLDLGRTSSLDDEVDFDAPSFEAGRWDFHDNDVESTNSSDRTSTHDPFVTLETMHFGDEDVLLPPFPPCSPGTPGRRKVHVHDKSNADYNYNESSSAAASILFTTLGRSMDWRKRKGTNTTCSNARENNNDTNSCNEHDQKRSGDALACDFDRWSMRDWDETVML